MANPRWVKGQSGNPGGRRKQDYRIKDLALEKCPAALKRLEEISKQNQDLRSAVAATMGILAYGIGKPVQSIDLKNTDGSLDWASTLQKARERAAERDPAEQPKQH